MSEKHTNGNGLLSGAEDFFQRNTIPFYHSITKAFVEHKLSLIKDFNMIAAVLLPALVVFVRSEIIKTPCLFYAGLASLVILLVTNFSYQRLLFNIEEKLVMKASGNVDDLFRCIVTCKIDRSTKNINDLDKQLKNMQGPILPREKSFFHKHGEMIIFSFFIMSIIFTTSSILFEINLIDIVRTIILFFKKQ